MSNSSEVKLKASERLSAIENALIPTQRRVGELEMIVYNLSRENEVIRDALQLMHEKMESVIALTNAGKPLTDENINETVVLLKEQSLKQKVQDMVDSNQIQPTDVITENSVVVGRELNKDGTVENPRIQFITARLIEELQNKFVGKKIGDLVKGEENKLDLEITEIYSVVEDNAVEEEGKEITEPEASQE